MKTKSNQHVCLLKHCCSIVSFPKVQHCPVSNQIHDLAKMEPGFLLAAVWLSTFYEHCILASVILILLKSATSRPWSWAQSESWAQPPTACSLQGQNIHSNPKSPPICAQESVQGRLGWKAMQSVAHCLAVDVMWMWKKQKNNKHVNVQVQGRYSSAQLVAFVLHL